MFINREKELQILENEYKSTSFSFSVLYGRRRVGKTTLLKKYMQDKDAIYFLVTLESKPVILKKFQTLIAEFFNDDFLKNVVISDISKLFEYIVSKNYDKKLIIVIDEFQYLSKIDSSTPSQFQYIVDEILKAKNIHLILCGSIISMMYEQTLSYNSPLYGRRTSAIKLEALRFEYIDKFFTNKTKTELIELYSVLYGVPKYLEMFCDTQDIFKSIETNILSSSAYLYDEPRYILQNEVNESITYFSILEVIASGEHKIGHIASKLGKNVQNITSFISKLIELDIIYKDVPITEKNPQKSKKGLYFIKNNFFRFWFLYVLPYKSQLEIGNKAYVLKKIKENFSSYVSKTYEDLSIAYTLQKYELLKCGRWWNKNEEIDVVGVGDDFLIVGECKYSNKKVGIDILEALKKKATKIESNLDIKHFMLFSKSGFTKELLSMSKNNKQIVLIENI